MKEQRGGDMLTQERYRAILDLINEKNAVTVSELCEILDTSESTVRRDLTALDKMGKLIKVYGGATSVTQTRGMDESNVSTREVLQSAEKTAIAKYAATLVYDSDFVYIDAGTTTSRFIDFLENDRATYITNGIVHARKLIDKGFDTHVIGGKVKEITQAVVGVSAIRSIQNLNFSKAFMGTNGIDLKNGFTTPDIDEALIKEAAIEHAYMTFMLADHTKFRRVFPVSFSPLSKSCIITDLLPDNKYLEETVIKEVSE